VESYLHRQQLWQSSDACCQERQNLQIRKSGSSQSVLLPPVAGVPQLISALPPKAPCQKLCSFLASPSTGIDTLLSVLKLEPQDTFYDLGCGDGRVVISVVKCFGCKGVGVDLNAGLIAQAHARAKAELASTPELLEKVTFLQDDIGKMSLNDAKVIYIYMPQDALHTLCSKVLPCTGIPNGTMLYMEEYWLHDRSALRHCKWKASHWDGQLHCYEWATAYGLPERNTF